MRILIIQNLMSQAPVPKAHAFYAGKPTPWAPYIMHAIIKEQMNLSIVQVMERQERKREMISEHLARLEEARKRQQVLQTALWSTFLSEM